MAAEIKGERLRFVDAMKEATSIHVQSTWHSSRPLPTAHLNLRSAHRPIPQRTGARSGRHESRGRPPTAGARGPRQAIVRATRLSCAAPANVLPHARAATAVHNAAAADARGVGTAGTISVAGPARALPAASAASAVCDTKAADAAHGGAASERRGKGSQHSRICISY